MKLRHSKVPAFASILILFGSLAGGVNGATLLVNAGFDTNLSSWATTGGAGIRSASPLPFDGGGYLAGFNTPLFTVTQDVDLIAQGYSATAIDAGSMILEYGGYQAGFGDGDSGVVSIELFDGAMSSLGTASLSSFTSSQVWVEQSGTTALLSGSRTIRYTFTGSRATGSNNDAYLDNAHLDVVPEPSSTFLIGIGVLGFISRRRRAT